MKKNIKNHANLPKGRKAGQGLRLRGAKLALCLFCAAFLCADRPDAPAQLAITEVMSSASTNGLEGGLQRPDFWELTNFGTNVVNLAGYRWFDKDDIPFDVRESFPATDINPGESIVFVRENPVVRNEDEFREWWGLPAGVRVYYWLGAPGFDGDSGDAVRIWDAYGNRVDEARFASALPGITFTYDTSSGAFTEFSQEGVAGAFRSAEGQDVGSPGYAANGPVALRITLQPISHTVDPGSEVILRVQAGGRPAPGYQWYSNGVPVPTTGAVSAVPRLVCFAGCGPSWRRPPGPNDLALPSIQPTQSGNYHVEAFNGLGRLTSAVVMVTVNTDPSPLRLECPPEEWCVPFTGTLTPPGLMASPGQTAIFTVRNRGYPPPSFQWGHSLDGVNFTELPGETNRDLTISNVEDADGGMYRVRLQNSNGTISAFARLSVKPSPRLAITEVMSHVCSPIGFDWWELTNTNAEPVSLCGYRWDDDTYSIGGGPTVTDDVVIGPGESVVLLESKTKQAFVHWWGASNLPPNLQLVSYAANGLGEWGDFIYVWDANETDPSKYITRVEFSGAIRGVTQWFDSDCGLGEIAVTSIPGFCGAFDAEKGCGTGSPGWTRWTPPVLTSVRKEGASTVLTWSAQPGSENKVQFTHRLASPPDATFWEDLKTFRFPSATCTATDTPLASESQRFYRVVRTSAANCPCPDDLLR